MFGPGTTRAVIRVRSFVLKFARHELGAKCNLFEANLFRRTTSMRRAMLCPVLWCSHNGALLIANSATPLTEEEASMLRKARGFPDWYYCGPGDDPCPIEPKASDWGRLKGRLVALDYSATVAEGSHHYGGGADEFLEEYGNPRRENQ